ncbi:MAG: ATP-dependent nuclease [Candidatus Hodarchaeales archaeon]|jgi:AAA15 family ATPase/GTPase
MFLSKVKLENFRSITSLTLSNLKSLNCFIGGHNSGKTNILDGLSIFWNPQIRTDTLSRKFHMKSTSVKEDFSKNILSYLNTNYIHGIFEFDLLKENGYEFFKGNDWIKNQFTNAAVEINLSNPFDVYDNFIDEVSSIVNIDNIKKMNFDMNLNPEFLEFIQESIYFELKGEEYLQFESINVPISIIRHAFGSYYIRRFQNSDLGYEEVRLILLNILRGKEYQTISSIEGFLQAIIDQEFIFKLGEKDTDGLPQIDVTIERAFSSPLWRISKSTLRLISIACLMTSDPASHQIIIIDNPGLYLHPRGERALARKLENLSKDRQLFFSTQSPRLLVGQAHLVELKKGWTQVERIKGKQMMRKVVKLLGIRPSDSFESDIVVFVEGRTDSRVFRVLEKKVRENNSDLPRTRVSYIGVGGWTNMKYVLSIELLKSKFVRTRAVAITDGDIIKSDTYLEVKRNWEEVFGTNGGFLSLKEESIESIFLNVPEVIYRYFVEKKRKRDVPVEELGRYISTRRGRNVPDKTILRDLLLKYNFVKRYTSKIAEQLARELSLNEIPSYLKNYLESNILNYDIS